MFRSVVLYTSRLKSVLLSVTENKDSVTLPKHTPLLLTRYYTGWLTNILKKKNRMII